MYYFSNLILPCVLIGKHSHHVYIHVQSLTKKHCKISFQPNITISYYPFSIDGSFGILFSSWVRRKSYPGNNNFDVLDIFHERCERYAAPFVWNTSHRNIFLLYHDHGSKLCGKCFRKIYYINLSELLSSMISSYYQLIIMVILGMYYPCAQLSSSISIKWSDAKMGANFIPSMDTLGAKDIKTRKQNHAKVHPPSKQGKIIVLCQNNTLTLFTSINCVWQ